MGNANKLLNTHHHYPACGVLKDQTEWHEDSSDLDEVTVCDRYSTMSESETESDELDDEPATEIVRDENFSEDEGSASDESSMSDDFEFQM